jgi:hypothetical protein
MLWLLPGAGLFFVEGILLVLSLACKLGLGVEASAALSDLALLLGAVALGLAAV